MLAWFCWVCHVSEDFESLLLDRGMVFKDFSMDQSTVLSTVLIDAVAILT